MWPPSTAVAAEASAAMTKGGELSRDPTGGSGGKSKLLFTYADGPEGFALAAALLSSPCLRQQLAGVVAAVESPASHRATELQRMGAEIRPMEPLQPQVFEGVEWAFVLAPLSADRLERGKVLLGAAWAARVPQVMLLSVVGAEAGAAQPGSTLEQYWALEQHLRLTWGSKGVVLRTFFYQQNLAFWAGDVQASRGTLRLPLNSSGGFAPLHQWDVAATAAAIARHSVVPPQHAGRTFNLTGPQALSAQALGDIASSTIGRHVDVKQASREEAMALLQATGQLDRSEYELLLDLLELQPALCSSGAALICPSPDMPSITGHAGTPVSRFFAENAEIFQWQARDEPSQR